MQDTSLLVVSNHPSCNAPYFKTDQILGNLENIGAFSFMGGKRGSGRRHRGPNLPDRTQDRESFHGNIKYPSGSEEQFARRHAELYGNEEKLVDGRHVGSAHFPRRSERARISGQHSMSNHHRDTTRNAYRKELDAAIAEREDFSQDQVAYYNHTSDGMLPRHHTALLPLARAREEPNFL